MVECDDGNNVNGDGCSSNCKIESFYECKGGNKTNKDSCVFKRAITIKSFTYYGNLSAILAFDRIVQVSGTSSILTELFGRRFEEHIGAKCGRWERYRNFVELS